MANALLKFSKKKVAYHKTDLNEDFKNSIYARKVSKIFNKLYGNVLSELKFVIPFAASMDKYATFIYFFLFL